MMKKDNNNIADINIGTDGYFICLIYLMNGYSLKDKKNIIDKDAYDKKFDDIYNKEQMALKESFLALKSYDKYMKMGSSFPVEYFATRYGANIFIAPLEEHIAIDNNIKELLEWLDKIGALNKLRYEEFDSSILMYEIANGRHSSELEIMTDCGADFSNSDNIGKTVLHLMALKNRLPAIDETKDQLDFFKHILTKVDQFFLNKKDSNGNTVLHYATLHKNIDIMQVLIRNGIDTEIQNNDGYTAEGLLGLKDLARANRLHKIANLDPYNKYNIPANLQSQKSFADIAETMEYFMDLKPSDNNLIPDNKKIKVYYSNNRI
jgi:hypothetical protein